MAYSSQRVTAQSCLYLFIQLPAVCLFDTMHNGKVFTLLRLQIIILMGVSGCIHAILGVGVDFCNHIVYNRLRLRCAERAVNKVILHIHNNCKFFSILYPFLSFYFSDIDVSYHGNSTFLVNIMYLIFSIFLICFLVSIISILQSSNKIRKKFLRNFPFSLTQPAFSGYHRNREKQ